MGALLPTQVQAKGFCLVQGQDVPVGLSAPFTAPFTGSSCASPHWPDGSRTEHCL